MSKQGKSQCSQLCFSDSLYQFGLRFFFVDQIAKALDFKFTAFNDVLSDHRIVGDRVFPIITSHAEVFFRLICRLYQTILT